jgi:hypothetical protein
MDALDRPCPLVLLRGAKTRRRAGKCGHRADDQCDQDELVILSRDADHDERRRDRIERAAPLVVVALRHLAPQGEELAALGHLHEDTPHTERTELVRDRAIRGAATGCCLRHRATLPRIGLTVKSEAARVACIASSDVGM